MTELILTKEQQQRLIDIINRPQTSKPITIKGEDLIRVFNLYKKKPITL